MSKTILKMALLCLPLALSACGDSWQIVYTKDVFPYGNERTAGVGVVYVREVMLPAKEIKLSEEAPAAEMGTMPEQTPMEKVFTKAQAK